MKWGISLLLLILFLLPGITAVGQQNGIGAPAAGETIAGVVTVTGTAVHLAFLRYELAFLNESNQGAGWIVFAESSQPVENGVLAIWDTTVGHNVGAPVFPDGRYQLRLRVVKTDYNYDEFFVTSLTIHNAGPTPTPTPEETAVAITTTPGPGGESTAAGGVGFNPPTALPSLTPFPTPTRPATPVALTGLAPAEPTQAANGGVLGQLAVMDTGRFVLAFWQGVRLTLVIFGLLAFYLLARNIGRRLWRKFWASRT